MGRLLRIGGVIVLLAFGVVLVAAVERSRSKDAFVRQVAAGALPPAPPLDLPALAGDGRVDLASMRGSIVVVNFWASWCVPCEDEAPLLARLADELEPQGVRFVGVNSNDVVDNARAFVSRFALDYAHGHDVDGRAKERWGVTGFPESFVIDAEGRAVTWFPGPIDADGLRAAVAKAAAP